MIRLEPYVRPSLAAAGGIGGLLAVQDAGASQDYVYFHDALGSVGQVLDLAAPTAGAAMVAKYEYDPYGHQTGVAGTYDQPFRFSGKYHDAETGLGYWGYRYYNPVLGRWLNRDPLEEAGGVNLYAYCANEPATLTDPLGLTPFWKRVVCCPYAYTQCVRVTGNVTECAVRRDMCLADTSGNACHRLDGVTGRGCVFQICNTLACKVCVNVFGVCLCVRTPFCEGCGPRFSVIPCRCYGAPWGSGTADDGTWEQQEDHESESFGRDVFAAPWRSGTADDYTWDSRGRHDVGCCGEDAFAELART